MLCQDSVTKSNQIISYLQILRLNGLTLAALGQAQVSCTKGLSLTGCIHCHIHSIFPLSPGIFVITPVCAAAAAGGAAHSTGGQPEPTGGGSVWSTGAPVAVSQPGQPADTCACAKWPTGAAWAGTRP